MPAVIGAAIAVTFWVSILAFGIWEELAARRTRREWDALQRCYSLIRYAPAADVDSVIACESILEAGEARPWAW